MSTFSGTYYNTTSGIITSSYENLPFLPEPITNPADTFIDGVGYSPNVFYINPTNGLPVEKTEPMIMQSTETIIANGVDTVSFINIPPNTLCEVEQIQAPSVNIIVNDGTLELTYNKSGKYDVTFSNSFYLPLTLGVTAT